MFFHKGGWPEDLKWPMARHPIIHILLPYPPLIDFFILLPQSTAFLASTIACQFNKQFIIIGYYLPLCYHYLSLSFIDNNRLSSYVIICHHMSSCVIICHHVLSSVIICHYLSSSICHHLYVIIYLSSSVIMCYPLSSSICHHLSLIICHYLLSSVIIFYHHHHLS